MKTLIFAIALLFATTTLASNYPEDLTTEQLTEFVESNVDFGLDSDIFIFRQYVDKTFYYGSNIENMAVAIRFTHCSIMWRQILEIIPGSEKLSHDMLKSGIWRAIETAKFHVYRAGGNPARVETHMVPMLLVEDAFSGKGRTDVTASHIYTCTALDLVTSLDMQESGIDPMAPEDWILEPIPELPEGFDPEKEQESSQVES